MKNPEDLQLELELPRARNKSHKAARARGWKFRHLFESSRFYYKKIPRGYLWLEIPLGQGFVRIYCSDPIRAELSLSRRQWIVWGAPWEEELRRLINLRKEIYKT